MSRRRFGTPVAAVVVAVLAACGHDLQFVRDDRLAFLAPAPRAAVVPPVEIAWRFRPGPGRARPAAFGVFVDRPPMRPGQTVTSLAEKDPLCRPAAGCPDREWLERHGVVLTRRHGVVLPALPASGGRIVGGRRLHEVSVVLLDARGARIGESGWTLRFFTPKGVG